MAAAQPHTYKVAKTYHIASAGGWDYIAVHGDNLYVTHGGQVNILNKETGDSVGVIPNTTGVHGIAFDEAAHRGFTSNGRLNNVTVFDLKNNMSLATIPTGENPDAIIYEPFTKKIITCNGRGNNLSFIDPKAFRLKDSIALGGKPETAVPDGAGMLYVNIEDKNEIAVVDLKSKKVLYHWSLQGGEGPTGLVYDKATKRLYAGCEKQLVVMNADNGDVITIIPIGDGCDGVAFNSREKIIYTSNGADGTMTIIKVEPNDKYTVLENLSTKRGARTITLDETDGTLFLPTADFDTMPAANGRPKMIPGTFQVLVIK
jgi:DNA-binding beta-propeller fold protein YncE